jgi:hypothetical protein
LSGIGANIYGKTKISFLGFQDVPLLATGWLAFRSCHARTPQPCHARHSGVLQAPRYHFEAGKAYSFHLIVQYVKVHRFWLPNLGGLVAVLRSPDRSLNTAARKSPPVQKSLYSSALRQTVTAHRSLSVSFPISSSSPPIMRYSQS